jgi:hypothetical protein
VNIKITYAGMCHSHTIRGEWSENPHYPMVPGHEIIGALLDHTSARKTPCLGCPCLPLARHRYSAVRSCAESACALDPTAEAGFPTSAIRRRFLPVGHNAAAVWSCATIQFCLMLNGCAAILLNWCSAFVRHDLMTQLLVMCH